MKMSFKRFIVFIMLFLCLGACTSTQVLLSSGKVYEGMSKSNLRSALLNTSMSEDPFLSGCYRKYFKKDNVEILSSKSHVVYFVFEDVPSPSGNRCNATGGGRLAFWADNYSDIQTFISAKTDKNKLSESVDENYSFFLEEDGEQVLLVFRFRELSSDPVSVGVIRSLKKNKYFDLTFGSEDASMYLVPGKEVKKGNRGESATYIQPQHKMHGSEYIVDTSVPPGRTVTFSHPTDLSNIERYLTQDVSFWLSAINYEKEAWTALNFIPIKNIQEWRVVFERFPELICTLSEYKVKTKTNRELGISISAMMQSEGIVCDDELKATLKPPVKDKKRSEVDDDGVASVSGSGSGFFVSMRGHLVTNNHVIDNCKVVSTLLSGKVYKLKVIAQDKANDLAVLKADYAPVDFFRISQANVELMENVYVAGFPFGDVLNSSVKVTKGIISSQAGIDGNQSQFILDAALQPGNSGGPIFNENGVLVGVAVAKLSSDYSLKNFGVLPENINFGVKASVLNSLLLSHMVIPKYPNYKDSLPPMSELVKTGTVSISCLN